MFFLVDFPLFIFAAESLLSASIRTASAGPDDTDDTERNMT